MVSNHHRWLTLRNQHVFACKPLSSCYWLINRLQTIPWRNVLDLQYSWSAMSFSIPKVVGSIWVVSRMFLSQRCYDWCSNYNAKWQASCFDSLNDTYHFWPLNFTSRLTEASRTTHMCHVQKTLVISYQMEWTCRYQ